MLKFQGNDRSLLFAFIIILTLHACKKDEFVLVDLCPSCTSLIKLNDMEWPSKPSLTWLQISPSLDTTFEIEIRETDPPLKHALGYLSISDIPYHVIEYKNDSMLQNDLHNHIYFDVWGSDTPYQLYSSAINASNKISVISINKSSGAFELSFDLTFHSIGSIPSNSPYPEVAHFTGTAQGMVTPK